MNRCKGLVDGASVLLSSDFDSVFPTAMKGHFGGLGSAATRKHTRVGHHNLGVGGAKIY